VESQYGYSLNRTNSEKEDRGLLDDSSDIDIERSKKSRTVHFGDGEKPQEK